MEPDLKELLEKDIEINEENNKILKKMQFSGRITLVVNIFKWVIIVGSVLGISYWFGPKIELLTNTYTELLK
jgi:uncharacterized phage-like protein YoqJ